MFETKEHKFKVYRDYSRENLLQYVERKIEKDLLSLIKSDTAAWIEELNYIQTQLDGDGLVAMTGMYPPPLDDPNTLKLTEDLAIYSGPIKDYRGLWYRKKSCNAGNQKLAESYPQQWAHYRLAERAQIGILEEYNSDEYKIILPQQLMPANFEPIAKKVEKTHATDKRPIYEFSLPTPEGDTIDIFAKGAAISESWYYPDSRPKHRLTNVSSITIHSSEKEAKKHFELAEEGILTPKIIGWYKALTEQFLFVQKIHGDTPDKFFSTHKETIIDQDSRMLASLCLAGYMKQGFCDFDDKIFDGKNLWLIDVDECLDLYMQTGINFRKVLINPLDVDRMSEFRHFQQSLFKHTLKDALYDYRNTLLKSDDDKYSYIRSFYSQLRQTLPNSLEDLITFDKNYVTTDNYLSMMSD